MNTIELLCDYNDQGGSELLYSAFNRAGDHVTFVYGNIVSHLTAAPII